MYMTPIWLSSDCFCLVNKISHFKASSPLENYIQTNITLNNSTMQPKLPICHTTPNYFLKPISDIPFRLQSAGTGADLMFSLSLTMTTPDWFVSFLPLSFMEGRQTSLAGAYLDQSLYLPWFSYKDVFILPSLIISFNAITEHYSPSLFFFTIPSCYNTQSNRFFFCSYVGQWNLCIKKEPIV